MQDFSDPQDQGGNFAMLARFGITRLRDVELVRLNLVAMLLAGPHAASDFLVEAVGWLMNPERDPSNPHDDVGKRLITIIQTMPLPNFVNPPGAEDIDEIEQLVKRDDDPLLLKLFQALGAGFSGADFLEMHPEEAHNAHNAWVRLRRSVLSQIAPAPAKAAASPTPLLPPIPPPDPQIKNQLVTPARIAAVLGGEPILGHRVVTNTDLQNAVEEGLPAAALNSAVDRVGYIPAKLRTAYKRLAGPLPRELGEKVARLARIIAVAEYVFDDKAAARGFLTTPRRLLSSVQTPLDAALDEAAARKVEKVLASIFYGLPV